MDNLPNNLQNPKKFFFTVSQAADFLNVSSKTLRRWESRGILIPQRTTGGQRRYQRQVLENFKTKKELTRVFIREYPMNPPKNFKHRSEPKLFFNQKAFYFLVLLFLILVLPLIVYLVAAGAIFLSPQMALQEPRLAAEEQQTLKAKEICLEDVCLTKSQLEKMIENLE